AVKLGVLREIVLEGNDGRAVEDQPLTGVGVGDVVLLAGRDVQRLRENLPVAGCLIQKVDKIRVFKDILYLAGRKQILDVLR
ncbi:preprotein translocase subunit SecG, partial [Dysosmobacter welbionis]